MDKEQAKFILQSFRPDGADASNEDFAQALQLAAEDRELGEWLAGERATDASFAAALNDVEIPEQLRLQLLAVMHGENPSDPEQHAAMDEFLTSTIAALEPPAELRSQIITAMENSVETPPANVSPISEANRKPWLSWAAIAAVVALGVFLALRFTSGPGQGSQLAAYEVQQEAAAFLNSNFELTEKDSNPDHINSWLVSHNLPNLPASNQLPTGMKEMKSLGCRMIVLPGDTKASLVCFKEDSGGMIHLVIVPNDQLKKEKIPSLAEVKANDCYHCPKSNWNIAKWRDEKNTFILLAGKNKADKNAVLKYF
ncbi:MAG: hypothetical protein ACPG32_02315 [Akkermansiaceae bacterium]